MSENFPGSNPFESGKKDDAPESSPSKKPKSRESKPASAGAEAGQQPEKQPTILDKLIGEKPAGKQEAPRDEPEQAAINPEETDDEPEITDKEATEALTHMAQARELEVGATELHGADAGAAETAEAEAAVELLQNVKAEAAGGNEGATVAEMLAIAEQRTIEALGLSGAGSEADGATGSSPEVVINPKEPTEAELPLRSLRTPAEEAAIYNRAEPAPAEHTEYVYYEPNTAGTLMLGGIIGYLIGRRRGRIKTEKKLLPVQRKLEREVKAIHTQLIDSEMRLRRLAAEKARRSSDYERKTRGAAPPERAKAASSESRLKLQKPASAERLGRVLMQAEAAGKQPQTGMELSDISPDRIRTMGLRELLRVSEKIIIEGSSLRRIYESRLVGEKGLRRLVAEHLRGKDIRKQLQREIVEREIDFERDPILRDKAYQEAGARHSSPTLQQLLQKAGAGNDRGTDALPGKAQQERYEALVRKAERRRRAADTAMVTVIVILAILVTVLVLQR